MPSREAVVSIPLVDLRAQHEQIAREVQEGWARVIERGAFILGEEVEAFERSFAAFCGVRHCVGVGNGTDALELGLRAIGVGPGGEVILPANSFVAGALAVVRIAAVPVLVDVDPESLLVDPVRVAERTGSRTKAVMPVHMFGQIAPVDALRAATDGRAPIFEDASHAHGARRHGIPAGGLGLAAGTSFYPGKNLGAYGDAGAVLTSSDEVARRVRALGSHGAEGKHRHPEVGFNSRLDTLQAVVLGAKLARLAEWNDARRAAAARYDALLQGLDAVRRPTVLPGNEHVWHLYVVRVPRRDEVLRSLRAAGIGAGVHYPTPTHLEGAFRSLGHREGDFPAAEAAAREVLSLPLFPHITTEQQERVVDELRRAIG